SGGEDYQLLYAAPPTLMEATLVRIPEAAVIGSVIEGSPGHISVVDRQGKEQMLPHRGWDHFHP
ncbi:MAG: thiamine-phosphate kinase, partial [Chloroflexi bacterium]|nr:thiamine-phosphate kinase [Chloroflexota bacterium]